MTTAETRELAMRMYGGRCAYPGCCEIATECHHAGKHNTKANRKRWPLFLESPFNKKPLCKLDHIKHPSFGEISDMQADTYEEYLRDLKGAK